jgi:hypothetical protein
VDGKRAEWLGLKNFVELLNGHIGGIIASFVIYYETFRGSFRPYNRRL